jgi:flagellar hook protein FlgE
MLRSLTSGVSGLEQFQQEMDVISNNIANINTTGYKDARVDFADALSQNLQMTGDDSSTQIGTGVTTESIENVFTQGSINNTGAPNDLAISGSGFFVVRDPATNATYATRAGDFEIDGSGYLVTPDGMRVQGYSDAGLSTIGDIQINNTNSTSTTQDTSNVSTWSFGTDGTISVTLADGTAFTRGQVLLQNFTSPQSLIKQGNNLYSNMASAGPLTTLSAPGGSGLGTIVGDSLEASNVDLSSEMATMITAQRAFEASSKIITTSDEMLQTLVNLKR